MGPSGSWRSRSAWPRRRCTATPTTATRPPRLSFRETTQKICDALSRFHDTVIPYEWFIDPKTDWPIPAPTPRTARFADVATAMLPERERAFAAAISDDPVFADLVLRLFDVYTAARRGPEGAPSPPPPRSR